MGGSRTSNPLLHSLSMPVPCSDVCSGHNTLSIAVPFTCGNEPSSCVKPWQFVTTGAASYPSSLHATRAKAAADLPIERAKLRPSVVLNTVVGAVSIVASLSNLRSIGPNLVENTGRLSPFSATVIAAKTPEPVVGKDQDDPGGERTAVLTPCTKLLYRDAAIFVECDIRAPSKNAADA